MQTMPNIGATGDGSAIKLVRLGAVAGGLILVVALLTAADPPAGWVIMSAMGSTLAGMTLALLYAANRIRDDEAELREMRERQRNARAIHREALKRSLLELVRLQVAEVHRHEVVEADETQTVDAAADKTIDEIIAVAVPFSDDDEVTLRS